MSVPVIYNGTLYNVPLYNDIGYAQNPGNLSQLLIALAQTPFGGGVLSLAQSGNAGIGGVVTLSGSTNIGLAQSGQNIGIYLNYGTNITINSITPTIINTPTSFQNPSGSPTLNIDNTQAFNAFNTDIIKFRGNNNVGSLINWITATANSNSLVFTDSTNTTCFTVAGQSVATAAQIPTNYDFLFGSNSEVSYSFESGLNAPRINLANNSINHDLNIIGGGVKITDPTFGRLGVGMSTPGATFHSLGSTIVGGLSNTTIPVNMGTSQVNIWIDEPNNKLQFQVKYSTGAIKSGNVTLS